MYIARIELENIKSHIHSRFEFPRGTTAITGPNGAGKTTIIEAIAWALFDLLEYKKEDFVRRGAKKGSVTITFESSLDEREYTVFRDTGTAYHVIDPRLGARIAEKKEEVFRFLWQHLALEPGTDLESLFRQAIGVPQGTFTAIFLERPTSRKIIFDRLLKVEEYRQAADKLRETVRYVDTGIGDIREGIARHEGQLARAPAVEEEHRSYRGRAHQLEAEAAKIDVEIEEKRRSVQVLDELERIETAAAQVAGDQKRLKEDLAGIEKARLEITALKPKVTEQEALEAEQTELRQKIADARALRKQALELDELIQRMRASYRTTAEQLKKAQEKALRAGDVVHLEKRDAELLREIAALNASLERDEKFQSEIKDGFCPVLSEKCLNLKPGQTLEAFVATQFSEIKIRIGGLESERSGVGTDLRVAREAERYSTLIDGLKQRVEQLKAEGSQLTARQKDLEERAAGLSEFEGRSNAIDASLRAMNDPRSRVRYLENETERESELREKQTQLEASLADLDADRMKLFERLNVLAITYDAEGHSAERSALHEAEKRLAELRAILSAARSREEQLAAELSQFTEIRRLLQSEFREKEQLEIVAETTAFIRDTLKEAAPRVARNYVHHVAVEAAQMFREIVGDAEKTLKWGEDYAVSLEQDGFERPFSSLSGGEQMAAALAVRLALLKQLSDIRIAFFDEPTANMDAERRENFAMQLGRITHFEQLFVVSHDDTFDQYVDNVITLGASV